MSIETHCASSTNVEDDVVLSWTLHLARAHPSRTVCVISSCLLAVSAGYLAIGPAGALATAFVLLGSLADYLFPLRYVLTKQGATCRMLLKAAEIRWADVEHVYLDDSGVKLSPLQHQSRLEAFRGVYLRFADNREEVIETVQVLRGEGCSD